VVNGYGTGTHAPGETVHVFSDVVPSQMVLTGWVTTNATLEGESEWHTTFTMPNHDVTVAAAAISPEPRRVLQQTTYVGVTTRPKQVYYHAPPSPRGLIMLFHGTGGNADFITKTESVAFWMVAVERGYAVLATEAEEVVAGDLNEDQTIRWHASDLTVDNVDFQNLNRLLQGLATQAPALATIPRFALGMSNGGAFAVTLGAVSSSPTLAAAFPNLRFKAAVSYCASGIAALAGVTLTPTSWFMCANDENQGVGEDGNAEARSHHETLLGRSIDSDFAVHPASPLYPERLARIDGITVETSRLVVAELAAAGQLDAAGYVVAGVETVMQSILDNPTAFPVLSSLTGAQKLLFKSQVAAARADHQFYSDYAARTVAFLDAHLSD
jgi:hypothetical protein